MESQLEFFNEFDTPKRPPKKSAPGCEPGAANNLQLIQAYRRSLSVQTFFGWTREAGRLFNQFWQTGNKRHLVAFNVHVWAMRARVSGGRQ
jgi:hypothetical protein